MSSPVVLRPRFSMVMSAITIGLLTLGVVSNLVPGDTARWPYIAPLGTVAWFVWLLFWNPAVCVGDTSVMLRNPLRTVTIDYSAITDIEARYSLELVAGDRSYQAWAAPAPSPRRARQLSRQPLDARDRHAVRGHDTVRPGDIPGSDSGDAAYLIRSHIDDQAGTGTPGTVDARWRRREIAVSIALVAASIASIIAASLN